MEVYKFCQECQAIYRNFCREISIGQNFPTRAFLSDITHGILATKSINVQRIAASLGENIDLKKSVKRLVYHLDKPNLGGEVLKRMRHFSAKSLAPKTIFALDITDIQKHYAHEMEGLHNTYDGSKKTVGQGYPICSVIASSGGSIIPLHMELYSFWGEASENQIILETIEEIESDTGKNGVWVLDRGGDRGKLLRPLIHRGSRFAVRSVGSRHVIDIKSGQKMSAEKLAKTTSGWVRRRLQKGKKSFDIKAGINEIALPELPDERLWLVSIRWRNHKPFMLLTNIEGGSPEDIANEALDAYEERWRIEETFRHCKSAYGLEKINVRTLVRLKNLVALFMVTMFCLYVKLGRYAAIKGMMLFNTHEKKVIKRPPRFIYYVATIIAFTVFWWRYFNRKGYTRRKNRRTKNSKPHQLELFDTNLFFGG